jgi:hypothetical protein
MGDTLVWAEWRHVGEFTCSDLYRMTLSTGDSTRLTHSTGCELEPRTNGKHIAYLHANDVDPRSLRLLDLETGLDIELAPDQANIESFDMNERYVVWVAYTGDAQSVGRDMYYRDLLLGQTFHIDATYERYQWWTFIWEDWVTWRGSDAYLAGPSHLVLYNLVTQEERLIVEEDWATSNGQIDDGLIFYNTAQYTGTTDIFPADIEVHDLRTSSYRRLTRSAGEVSSEGFDYPYLVIIRLLYHTDRFMNDFYVANLERLGVTDASGLLVPGDPVIDPP